MSDIEDIATTANEHQEDVVEGVVTRLPVLYGIDSKGKERLWETWVIGNTVYRKAGLVGKKLVASEKSHKGKNKGKKNATTDEEQAILEAERSWVKQLDKTYLPKCKAGLKLLKKVTAKKEQAGGTNHGMNGVMQSSKGKAPTKISKTTAKKNKMRENNMVQPNIEKEILPMHCQTFSLEAKCLKHFDFEEGVYLQPKLDGIRAVIRLQVLEDDTYVVVITTRKGKQVPWMKHLRTQVLDFLRGYEDIILDVEIYAHVLIGEDGAEIPIEGRFGEITGAASLKRSKPHPLEEQLEIHVFDIINEELDQDGRFAVLKDLFERDVENGELNVEESCPNIKMVETRIIYSPDEIAEACGEFSEIGYEGVVVRARDLMYKQSARSLKMRKYKEFIDAEFPIVGLEWDEGVGREHFTWVCEMEDGTTFNAKPKGTREQKYVWHDAFDDDEEQFIGQPLTVRYQKPSEDGIPRFPVGIAIRNYE